MAVTIIMVTMCDVRMITLIVVTSQRYRLELSTSNYNGIRVIKDVGIIVVRNYHKHCMIIFTRVNYVGYNFYNRVIKRPAIQMQRTACRREGRYIISRPMRKSVTIKNTYILNVQFIFPPLN